MTGGVRPRAVLCGDWLHAAAAATAQVSGVWEAGEARLVLPTD